MKNKEHSMLILLIGNDLYFIFRFFQKATPQDLKYFQLDCGTFVPYPVFSDVGPSAI